MAQGPVPTEDERNANLSNLQKVMKRYADEEIKRLDNETKFMRAVVKGRTGSEKLGTELLTVASELVQVEIDQFILAKKG